MSRIGRRIINVPSGVTIEVAPGRVTVTGPKGTLEQNINADMKIVVDEGVITIERPTDRPNHRALHGLTRSLVANMVEGVANGYEKQLEIQGVGYRCQAQGKNLELALGYSHAVKDIAPEGIEFEVPQPTQIIVRGIDKQRVGQVAAEIRKLRPPEPYKGKGIRYVGEHVVRKVGKRA
ncbi:MAG: 50S ribosomal protein L6 [Actinobacteria bacterium]|nr:50S ribosomal protein L6 [Actinomycetota bacterium]